MEHCTKNPGDEKEIPVFGPDSIEMAMRLRIRDTIEALVKQESWSEQGAAVALAGHRDSTLYGSQAEKLAGEGAGARARRAD